MVSRVSHEVAVKELLHLTEGLVQGQRRHEVMGLHGFRKYFATTLETERVNPVYIEFLLGHDMGLESMYSKPNPTQLLEGNGAKYLEIHMALML